MTNTPTKKPRPLECLIVALLLYMAVAHIVFALRHPWLTETQRLMHTPDVLMWRAIEKE